MTRDVTLGLALNTLGVALFALWLLLRSSLPSAVSIALALLFCALLGSSLFFLGRSARRTSTEPRPPNASSPNQS